METQIMDLLCQNRSEGTRQEPGYKQVGAATIKTESILVLQTS